MDNEIVLNLEMWKAFIALLEKPPEPSPKLLETMRKHHHWVEQEDWMESFNDEIQAGSAQGMTYQERYEFVKSRTYSKHKK